MNRYLFIFVLIFSLLFPFSAKASNKALYVFEVCGNCHFPAEIGVYKHLKAVESRYTLFRHIPDNPIMVREIWAERKGKSYRIITLVASTQSKSTGIHGQVIEIVESNGPYWPGTVIYQLTLTQIDLAYTKMNKNE